MPPSLATTSPTFARVASRRRRVTRSPRDTAWVANVTSQRQIDRDASQLVDR